MGRFDTFHVAAGTPLPQVQAAAHRYSQATGIGGLAPRRDFSGVKVDPVIARHVASLYQGAPMNDPAAHPSFQAMAEETKRQYEHMTGPTAKGGLGLTHEVTASDPYVTKSGAPNSVAMMRDIHENSRIKSLATATTGSHPFFDNDTNDMFRAVHDVFGHAGTGRNFTADGEEAAYRAHRQMFSPLARGAMTAETRGQNSVNNFGGLAPGQFARQKVATLGPTAQLLGRRSLMSRVGNPRQFGAPTGMTG